MDHRIRIAQATAAEELLSRVKVRNATTEGAPAVPATSPIQEGTRSIGSTAGSIAKDIGLGLVETPRALVKGVRDAYQNTIDLADDVGSWIEKAGNLPGIIVDSDAPFIHPASGDELQAAPRLADEIELPDIGAPKSVTGGVVKGVTQFLVGMKGASKLLDVSNVPKAAGPAGYARTALQGAIANFAAFDPHQQRLSNLVEQFPALQNPVTDFLASKPDDSDAEGRFKNALEGLGLGVATDGFFKGVKLLRQAAQAKTALSNGDELARAAADAPRELADDAFKELGDEAPEAALVKTIKPKTGALPGDLTPDGAPADNGSVFINFARIDTTDDVKDVMQKLANASAKSIDKARRGTQTFEQTKFNASQEDAWNILMTRRQGQPLNDAQSVAARELWVTSTDKLAGLAETAAANPSEANLFAFRKMLSVHDAVQKEVIAARTETARALSSWRIPVGSNAERLQSVAAILEQHGGTEVTRELAARVSALAKAGMTSELQAVVGKGAYATSRDAVVEAWINGLLSNPTTHAANMISNSSVVFLRMAERGIAAKISSFLGSEGGIAAGEASAQWFGLTQGMKDAFRYAAKAARTGESGYGLGKLETAREGAITSEAFGLSSNTATGRAVDMLGSVVRTPGRALVAEDEFFKTIGYRMELSAQALRQAASELPDATDDALKTRIAEIVANPPQNVRMAAIDAATYQTFNNAPGEIAKSLSKLTTKFPALKVILPFTRTPANILRFTFERTPIAPVMSKFRSDIAAGGARRDLALAQVSLGTAGMLAFADATMNGQITGRGPVEKGQKQAMQREGWKPYSLKIGNRWVSYNRLDPIGSLVGMSADATEMLMQAQHDSLDDPDTEKLAVATALAFAGNITNKTYLSGLSSIIEALNDPQRSAESWTQRLAGSVVPAGVAQIARLNDPIVREVDSMMDAIRARTPGLSANLPPRMDMWGEPLKSESGLGKPFDAFSPIYTQQPTPEPIDKEILRIESNVTAPPRRTSFNGVTVDLSQYPKAYSRYVELSGNAFKHPAWGYGAKDLLNKIVTGDHPLSAIYQLRTDGPDGGKDVFIRDTLRQYREMARKQLLEEYPDLAKDVAEKQANQRALKAIG